MNPPTGRRHDVDPRQATLVLELPSSGGTHIGGKRFTDDELDRVLRAAATNPQTQVVVRANRRIELGRVVQMIERARTLGIDRVVIGARAPGDARLHQTSSRWLVIN